jgi:hypothetical protein
VGDWIASVIEPPNLSALFGGYLLARLDEGILYRNRAAFDKTMSWLEADNRSLSVQTFISEELTAKLLLTEPNPPGYTERFVRSLLRILGSTADNTLATEIENTYLPNLLGLEGAAPRKTAQTVFQTDNQARARARAALLRRPASSTRDLLVAWIDK